MKNYNLLLKKVLKKVSFYIFSLECNVKKFNIKGKTKKKDIDAEGNANGIEVKEEKTLPSKKKGKKGMWLV